MKAGNKGATVGQDHPSPDMIPHSNPSGNHQPNVPHHMATMNAGDGSSTPKEEEKV